MTIRDMGMENHECPGCYFPRNGLQTISCLMVQHNPNIKNHCVLSQQSGRLDPLVCFAGKRWWLYTLRQTSIVCTTNKYWLITICGSGSSRHLHLSWSNQAQRRTQVSCIIFSLCDVVQVSTLSLFFGKC